MKKLYLMVMLGIFVSAVLSPSDTWAARALTASDVEKIVNAKAEEIATVAASKATRRLDPSFKAMNSTLDTLRTELDMLKEASDEQREYLQSVFSRLDANVKEIQSTALTNSAQLSGMTVATNESLRDQKEEMSRQLDAEREEMKKEMSQLLRKIEGLEAQLNKRGTMRTAVTLGGVGLAIAFVIHVLDHEGR